MNQQNNNINVSNSNNDKKEKRQSQSILLEKELKEIYNTQYNDLFPKILTKTKSEFLSLLKSQVSLHLKIINKTPINSLETKYLEIYTKKFFSDKAKATKGLEDILKNVELQKINLELINCYIHCHKCSKILHACKNKLIIYKGFIYCINCQKVYNENQIKLYCEECKVCYYSKLRYVINKKFEAFYNVCFGKYHCPIEEPEKIKCLECGHDLYYNIFYEKKNLKKDAIFEVFCLKCKLSYDLNDVFFRCKICKNNFKSEAKIDNNFSFLKIKFLLIMHTLRKKKFALPEKRVNRKCKCDLTKYEKYFHEEDKGTLYLGHNLKGEYIILCDCCYSIFNYNDFVWTCPICNVSFKSKKNLYKKNYSKATIFLGDKINPKIEKSPTMFKSPSNVNIIHRRKILESIPASSGEKAHNNIIKNLFNKNNNNIINQSEQKSSRNNNKFNHITKIIMLTTNKKNKNVNSNNNHNVNLSEQKVQKVHLFKKIGSINVKSSNFHTSITNKENDIRKTNLKSFIKNKNFTNANTLNSIVNGISSTNNKSESTTNKCNDSTNITSKNNECCNEVNNKEKEKEKEKEKSHNYIIEQEQNGANNSKINRKLLYNDFIEEENNSINNIIKIPIKANNYNSNNNNIKKQTNEEKLYKTSKKEKESINYIVIKKERINHKKLEIKKINQPLQNKLNKEPGIIITSIDNNKKSKDATNEFIVTKINNNDNKFKNNKSMRNIRATNNNLKVKIMRNNTKVNNNNINQSNRLNKQPPKTSHNSSNKIKFIKNSINNIESNSNKENKDNNNNNNNNNKIIIVKEKKQISRCPTQVLLRNRKNDNDKKNMNSIFKKIKEYYEESINNESLISKEKKNIKNNNSIIKLNKSIPLTAKKKIAYKTFFHSENYSILKLLGKGTYAKTYLVEDPKTKERFALKKITINDKIELKENQEEYNLILQLTKEYPELKIINIYGIEIKKLDKYTTVMYVLMEAAKSDWEKEIMHHLECGSYYKEEHLMKILIDLVKTFAILQR